jgi:hypothetical protein
LTKALPEKPAGLFFVKQTGRLASRQSFQSKLPGISYLALKITGNGEQTPA